MEHRILGDYTIIKPIGQGALGLVFLAEHRFMKKQYVLKVLPEELSADRNFIQRFEEEVSSLASLEHPHIVKIYNISFAQGVYFLVTDCIVDELGETTNLAQYVAGLGRSLGEEEIFSILKKIANALDYAHSKRIGNGELIHLNLKLNNILVGKRKDSLEVYLSDFGLSRIIGSGAVLTRTFKNVAEVLGLAISSIPLKSGQERYPVPPLDTQKLIPLHVSFLQNYTFFAPEQKRLDSIYPITAKADSYAFGVLAYFLLMDELPEGIFEMPSSRGCYSCQWDNLLLNCLQYQPDKRPEFLEEALNAVRQSSSASRSVRKEEVKPYIQQEIKAFVPETANNLGPLIPPVVTQIPVSTFVNPVAEPVPVAVLHKPAVEEIAKVETSIQVDPQVKMKAVLQASQLERPQTDLNPSVAFQTSAGVKVYNPEPKDVPNVNPLMTDMVIIEGGTFQRGSKDGNRDETPRHSIYLNSYAIEIHPVTNEQFVRFLEVMGGEKDSQHNDIIRLKDSRIKRSGGKLSIETGYAKHPVVGVTWYGAVAYAKWIGKRLPTEAEWEVAARGLTENALYPSGDEIEKNQANFFSSDTTAVMSYAPNGCGLYDMAGNVYEWCHDWYGYNYYETSLQEPDNPKGPLQGVYRVLRGGCWKSLKEDLRCSRRHRNNPGTVNSTYGFRCVADVQSN